MIDTSKIRTYETLKEMFEEDKDLYKVFLDFCEYTTNNAVDSYSDIFVFDLHSISYQEYIAHATRKNIIEKCSDVIKSHIDTLIRVGLICYETTNPFKSDNSDPTEDDERFNHYKALGHPSADSRLVLTECILGEGCTGSVYYGMLLKKEDEAKRLDELNKKFEESFIASAHEALDPDINKIKELANSTEKKLQKIEKEINQNATKNIEVLSVFVAIIALLFSNITGIQNYQTIGLNGLLVLNASIVLSITFLVLIVELLIIKDKINLISKIIIPIIILICIFIICA